MAEIKVGHVYKDRKVIELAYVLGERRYFVVKCLSCGNEIILVERSIEGKYSCKKCMIQKHRPSFYLKEYLPDD